MRFPLGIIGILIAGGLSGAPVLASTQLNPDESALRQLSHEWMSAIQRKDREKLGAILAPEFVLQMPGDTAAQVTPREEWLKNAIKMDWSNFRYENLAVTVSGNHATVSSRLYFRIAPFPFALDSGVVDIWRKRDGRWQVSRRYLGHSEGQQRIAFLAGLIAAFLLVGLVYLTRRISRRARRRPGELNPQTDPARE